MTELIRVQAEWRGFSGAPGYSVMHFRDFGSNTGGGGAVTTEGATAAYDRMQSFFTRIRTILPSVVSIQVDPEVSVVEDTNGEMVNSFTARELVPVQGEDAGPFVSASGGVVNWRTGGFRRGRRVRGRTFVIPLGGSVQDTDGGITDAARGVLLTAAATLTDAAGSPDLMVYARPSTKGATDGAAFVVTGATVPNKLAVLRSRRD